MHAMKSFLYLLRNQAAAPVVAVGGVNAGILHPISGEKGAENVIPRAN
jgi:hypothetical protein